MNWYEETSHTLAMAIARMDAAQRRAERELSRNLSGEAQHAELTYLAQQQTQPAGKAQAASA